MHLKQLLLIVGILFFFASGCETMKGLKQDTLNSWEHVKEANEWVKENLW